MKSRKTRREFLKNAGKVSAAVGAIGATWPLMEASARTRTNESPVTARTELFQVPASPVAENGLLQGIGINKPFSGKWRLSQVHGPVAGGLTLVLQEGPQARPLRVDLCLLGDEAKAPVTTHYLELFVMDGGGGSGCIDEGLFDALEVLGKVIRKNEKDPRLLEGILTFEERWELYPDFMACAAKELVPGEEPRER